MLEIAHSPSQVSTDRLEQLRQEISERGLLFRITEKGKGVVLHEFAEDEVKALAVNGDDVYVGVNKNEPALLGKVNEILASAKADGALEKNAQTWLKEPLPADL